MANVLTLQKKYKLDPIELACVSIFMQTNDKTFAWSYSVGRDSQSKNKTILAGQWFRQERIQKYLFDHNIDNEDTINEKGKTSDTLKDKVLSEDKNKDGITSDNIKELLEHEYNKTTKQEKRVELLMKIAEFVGAKKTTEDGANLPVIYLPARCKECQFRNK